MEDQNRVLPSNSSPAVSLEGATLMHLLVNLNQNRIFFFNDLKFCTVALGIKPEVRRVVCEYLMGSLVALSFTMEEEE